MFCGKCGAENSDGAVFCSRCGAEIAGSKQKVILMETKENSAGQSGDHNRIIGMVAVGLAALIVIIIAVMLFGGRSYKTTVNKYFGSLIEADAKEMISLYPKAVINEILATERYEKDELIEEVQESLDKAKEYYLDDLKVSYKILDAYDLSGKELRELKSEYEEEGIDIDISGAKIVEVEFVSKYEDDEYEEVLEIYVIKVGRSWYIDIANTTDNLLW